MVPPLAPHDAPPKSGIHVLEDIPRVPPHPKSQDGDAHGVLERSAFAVVAGAAASVRVAVELKAATACAASTTTSTAASPTGSYDLCRHRQLNSHCLGSTGGRETGRLTPHVTLLDKGLKGEVQARWAVVGEEPEIVMEVTEGHGGEGARTG